MVLEECNYDLEGACLIICKSKSIGPIKKVLSRKLEKVYLRLFAPQKHKCLVIFSDRVFRSGE